MGLGQFRFVFQSELEQRVAAAQFQLGANIRPVVINRPLADAERGGYLTAGLVLGDQLEDAALGRRQLVQAGLAARQVGDASGPREQVSGQGRADEVLSGGDRLDAADDVLAGAVFEHVALRPQIERFVKQLLVLVHRQEDDLHIVAALADGLRRGESVHLRHVNIEDDDVGARLFDQFKRRASVFGLAYHFKTRRRLDHSAQPLSDDWMVVNDQYFDVHIHSPFSGSSIVTTIVAPAP